MSYTDDVLKKKKSQLGLSGKAKGKFQKQEIHEVLDPEFGNQKDFFRQVDEIIKSGREDKLFLNSLNKLYKYQNNVEIINSNPYCFEYISDPEGKYELSNSEVQILQEINHFVAKKLKGIKIGDLYKTTKIVLCDAPKDSDLLGSYYLEEIAHYNGSLCPVIEIYMDKVEAVAKELGFDRAYVTACVYIHEMMHRYYDIRPDLGWKKSVKEIEEPMAVFGAMKFCEEFDKELLKMSRRLTEDLQKSERYDLFQYYVYILGLEMLDNGVDAGLINTYRHVSLMMHKSRSEVDGFVNPIDSYVVLCKQNRNNLENLVGPIQTIIGRFFSLFPNN